MKPSSIQKRLLTVATLALTLWLTGCAQVPKTDIASPTPTPEVQPEVQPVALPEVKAIDTVKTPVAKPKAPLPTEPPADIWVRIRQGFAHARLGKRFGERPRGNGIHRALTTSSE
jgi:hypothetical protein